MPPQDANPTPSFGGFGLKERQAAGSLLLPHGQRLWLFDGLGGGVHHRGRPVDPLESSGLRLSQIGQKWDSEK